MEMSHDIIQEASAILKFYVSKFRNVQKAAILLNSLSPDTSLEVLRYMTEKENRVLVPELRKMPYTNSVETVAVIDEFLQKENLWEILGGHLTHPDEILPALEKWAKKNPRKLARLMKELWLSKTSKED
jgi:flagellar motor switch protein FliG